MPGSCFPCFSCFVLSLGSNSMGSAQLQRLPSSGNTVNTSPPLTLLIPSAVTVLLRTATTGADGGRLVDAETTDCPPLFSVPREPAQGTSALAVGSLP